MDLTRRWTPPDLERALNSLAPPDIAFTGVRDVPAAFHARFSATGRRYAYLFSSAPTAFNQRRALHPPRMPDAAYVRGELAALPRHRDFASLCLSGSDNATTECSIQDSQWWVFPKGAMLTVQADRFLYGMMRALVGTLLEGHLRRQNGYLDQALSKRSRSEAGPTAPPWGLYLVRAVYAGDPAPDSRWPADLAASAGITESGETPCSEDSGKGL
jgi:tRNA pseudouridine38-40 synthase